ncbi:MAG TPA: hypothetical protein VGY50_08950 [Streptosporangiaceae bacterium]|nr:hypothetical protein [Streptosporangiaceae bacterium]
MTVASLPARPAPAPAPRVAPRNMARLLWVELRHNAMPLVLPLIAVLFWFDSYRIAAALPPLWVVRLYYILGQGHALIDFAPIVAGVAAWMGSRDGRRGVGDLVTATVRPRWEAQLTTWAATVVWAVGAYLVFMAVTLYLLGRSVAWGSPPWWPVAVGAVGVAAFASLGFALGAFFPGRFIAPVAAFGGLFAMGTSSQIGFSASGGWALILPTMSTGNFGQDAGIFYQFLPDLPIARVIFAAGVAAVAVGLLGLPVSAGGLRLRRSAAVVTATGAAAAVAAIVLAFTAHLGPYGTVIPALHDAASDRPIPYTPVCGHPGIPVCLQPAYRPYLSDVTTALRPVISQVAGLPGVPVRASQVAAVFAPGPTIGGPTYVGQILTLSGSPPVLYMPVGAIALPGSFGADSALFVSQLKVEFAHALVTSGAAYGNPAQQAVEAALLQHAGIPLAAQPDALGGTPWPLKNGGPRSAGAYPPPIAAAAQRFAALPATARHAWLAAHLGALRAGQLPLAQLP